MFGALLLTLAVSLAEEGPTEEFEKLLLPEISRPSDAARIREQIKTWDRMLVDHDYDALGEVLTEEYLGSGSIVFALRFCDSKGITLAESNRDNLEFRFYGDVALVTGQWTQRVMRGPLGASALTFHFTDLWVERDGTWKCVTSVPDPKTHGLAHCDFVRLGPSIREDLVVLFVPGATYEQRDKFLKRRVFNKPYLTGSYGPREPIEGHDVIVLYFENDVSADQRKKVVDRMVREPVVFRVFTDVAVIDVELEGRGDP